MPTGEQALNERNISSRFLSSAFIAASCAACRFTSALFWNKSINAATLDFNISGSMGLKR